MTGTTDTNQPAAPAASRHRRPIPAPVAREDPATPSQLRFQAIHQTLRERITLLEYRPGTVLDIDALAKEFEVSRTPVRSVLQQLAYHGLVISRHGVKTCVAPVDFDQVHEAKQFRSHLAELIGELSPHSPGPAAIATMTEALADCGDLIDRPDLRAFARIDARVHGAICSLIGNRQLLQTYDDLYYRTARVWFYFLPQLDWREEVSIFHQDIASRLRAMQQGDTRAVGFLTRNAVSAVLIRLDTLICRARPGSEPGEPQLRA